MSQSLSHLLIHIVFSTKNRTPFIIPEVEYQVYQILKTIVKSLNCELLIIGGMPDHIHILVELSPMITVSEFISKIKSNSSRCIKN